MHYLQLWKEARAELRAMRQELVGETDGEVIEEVKRDMIGLKKRKDELAKFLGIEQGNNEAAASGLDGVAAAAAAAVETAEVQIRREMGFEV